MSTQKNNALKKSVLLSFIFTSLVLLVVMVQRQQSIRSKAAKPIAPVTMIDPNGGEVWQRGETYTITWDQNQTAAWAHLLAYTGRGNKKDTLLGAIEDYVPNVIGRNTYSWTIGLPGYPAIPDGDNIIAEIHLYDANGNTIYADKSDSTFTIFTANSPVTTRLIDPNGGEVWQRGETYTITWDQNQTAARVHLLAYTRKGRRKDTLLGAIEDYVPNVIGRNTYSWTIGLPGYPAIPDGDNIIAEIHLYDANGNTIYADKSDSTFTIFTP